jgi:HD-GYP domain-containing protein (c-di-GMP phosphodiesterase class II)
MNGCQGVLPMKKPHWGLSALMPSLILWGLVLFALYLTSLYSYLLFHSLTEMFSIVIACGVFLLAWNARRYMENGYLLFVGLSALFIGALDAIHTLAYRGMGVFQGFDSNLATQLWIAARYLQSLSLLLAPVFFYRKLNTRIAIMAWTAIVVFVLASIFYWKIFPVCYVEGAGLTPFKIVSEYIISALLLASIVLLYRNRSRFEQLVFWQLVFSLVTLVFAELAFTTYISVYGFANFVGHLLRIISFYFLYQAIVVSGLMRPYDLLFRDLKQSEYRLQQARDELEVHVQLRTAELAEANRELSKVNGTVELQLERLHALREIDLAIIGSTDIYIALRTVLEKVTSQLQVDAACILLLNPHTQSLEFASGSGFHTKNIERSKLRVGQGSAGQAALEQRLQHIPDLSLAEQSFLRSALIVGENFVTYFAVPLTAKGNVNGVLEIYQRRAFEPSQDWLDFLQALANQAAIAVDNNRLFSGLHRANLDLLLAYDETIEGWSRALDLRDKETEGHTQRVAEMTLRLARAAGLGETELIQVYRGALLHDIGKMGVPDSILLKPEKLNDEEWEIMRKHPEYAFEILSSISYLRPALDIPNYHHENWDGTGYPRGLKGENIPLAARLFAVVDVWDALRSDRPYHEAWKDDKVYAYLRSLSGTRFDPKAVTLFLEVVGEE